jgi:hypothetical protein
MIMQRFSKFALLSLSLLAAACNESISPELLDSANNGNSPFNPTPTQEKEWSFQIVSTSPEIFNHHLHKTGLGNKITDCKITNNKNFTAIDFSMNNATAGPNPRYDITCFLEAEENSLYYNGFSLEILATAELCPYVAYEPFYFVQWPVGRSTRSMRVHRCGQNVSSANVRTASDVPAGLQGIIGCNQAADTSASVSNPTAVSFVSYQDLCDFDHTKSKGPNCDEGVINIDEITYNERYNDDGDVIGIFPTSTKTRHECGGKAKACLAGGGLSKVPEDAFRIMYITEGKAVKEPLEIESPFSKKYKTNMSVANYVRQCSGRINNNDWNNFRPSDPPFSDLPPTDVARREFIPDVMERYANGRKYWNHANSSGSVLSSVAAFTFQQRHDPVRLASHSLRTDSGRTMKYLAADAFMGIGVPTNPYYSFYCLDSAKDIKARIRLAVRDWDRTFAKTDHVDLLSDIFYRNEDPLNISRFKGKMDTDNVELPQDDNPFNDFNDVKDWDDFLSIGLAVDQDGLLIWENNKFKVINRRMSFQCDGPDATPSTITDHPFDDPNFFEIEDAPWYSPNRFPRNSL